MASHGFAALLWLALAPAEAEGRAVESDALLVRRDTGATDGSGAAPYRNSPSFLLFAIVSLLLGALLLVGGKRLWKVTTALGAGLLVELLVWITIVNLLDEVTFSSSATTSGMLVWGITSLAGVVGLAAGAFFWRLGMGAMCVCAGMSLGFSIAMMARNCLPVAARWIIIAVLSLASLILCPLTSRHFGMALATALTGSFLFFLGIDVLAMETSGASLGLRYMLDRNDSHAAELAVYHPPVVTRVLLAMSWVVAALASLGQILLWREKPFIRNHLHQSSPRGNPNTNSEKATDPELADLEDRAESFRTRMNRRYQLRLAQGEKELRQPYDSESSEVSAETLQKHMRDLTDMTSPDAPPSPPETILSTRLADDLRSRPPTFFNEPISTPTALNARNNAHESPYFASALPAAVVATGHDPEPISAPLVKNNSSGSTDSKESRRSWRKPVPAIPTILLSGGTDSDERMTEPVDLPVARRVPDSHGVITDNDRVGMGFATGLASGRDQSIALTSSTPASDDTSAFIKPGFGATPPLPLLPREEEHTSLSFPTGPRLSTGSSLVATELAMGDRRAEEFVPFTVFPPSDEAYKHRSYNATSR